METLAENQKTKAAGAQSRTAFETDYDDHTLFITTIKPSRLHRHGQFSKTKKVRHE